MKKLARKIGLRIESEMVGENPSNPDWTDAYHYKVTLYRNNPRRQLTTHYSMGYAHCYEPVAVDVLDCLISDASSIDYAMGFEDWAADFGYDTDSRKAERIYKACESIGHKVKKFLGSQWDAAMEAERL